MTNDRKANKNGCMDIKSQLQQKEDNVIPLFAPHEHLFREKGDQTKAKGIVYPNVNVKNWCKKWDLTLETYRCPDCAEFREKNIAFIAEDMRGVTSGPCSSCGSKKIRLQYTILGEVADKISEFFENELLNC